jgi:uncharacterized membrane-anchored protein
MTRHWPIVVVLVVQLGILVYLPAAQVRARISGTAVTLRTEPVDPYDLLSGYYMTLTYEVEQPDSRLVPRGLEPGERVWLELERGNPAWRLTGVSREQPAPKQDRVSVPARWRHARAEIEGAGRLYIPEAQRERAERLNRESSGRGLVDLMVGADGTVAVLRLKLGDKTFGE